MAVDQFHIGVRLTTNLEMMMLNFDVQNVGTLEVTAFVRSNAKALNADPSI
jgi:hypothetical protein